jgi:hypothetical protein
MDDYIYGVSRVKIVNKIWDDRGGVGVVERRKKTPP